MNNSLKMFHYTRINNWGDRQELVKNGNKSYDKLADKGYVTRSEAGFGYVSYTLTNKGKKKLGLS